MIAQYESQAARRPDWHHDKDASRLVACVENDGYAVSLEKRKIYVALRDAAAGRHNMLRIVIASEAKQSMSRQKERVDCFVASLLAMTWGFEKP
jgi:microcompartment protein CcmK/EutM